jgi:hypothetical protein
MSHQKAQRILSHKKAQKAQEIQSLAPYSVSFSFFDGPLQSSWRASFRLCFLGLFVANFF